MKKILVFIILIALALRLLWFYDNFFFGFEQGRDFIKLSEIASGNFTLIGPKTDINGIFHGALSYYSLMPSFLISGGNPHLVAVSLIFFHGISIYFLFRLACEYFGKKWAYLAIILYSVSYTSIVYSRWLSNPNLVPPLTVMVLYFLSKSKEKKLYLVAAAICWAVIFHLQVIAAGILVLPVLYVLLARKIYNVKYLFFSVVAVLLVLSSYIIFNLKNDNILVAGIKNYITSEERANSETKLNEFFNETVDNYFPANRRLALALFWVVVAINVWSARKYKTSRQLIVLFFAAPVVFVALGTSPLRHLFILNSLFTILLLTNAVKVLPGKNKAIIGFVIISFYIAGNVHAIVTRLPESNRNFIYHAQSTYYRDEIRILDYIYKDAQGKEFSYNYYTVPYWQPEAWKYLFDWYGKRKYGYLPVGEQTDVFYVIYEPDETQPKYQKDWYENMNKNSIVLTSFESGKLKAEKRKI